jgi:hypothetical protein
MTIYSLRPIVILVATIISFYVCAIAFRRATTEKDWRRTVLSVWVLWGVLVWLFSEVLSLFNLLAFTGILLLWASVLACILAFLIRKGRVSIQELLSPPVEGLHLIYNQGSKKLKFLWICLILIILVLGLIALIAAPNNWDSMTYHLSKVMHWQQNQSIRFYPTHILRQLFTPPWAEMAILQLQILAGNDRLANFVQFFAMIGSLTGVSLIAKLLGGNCEVQLFSSLATLTIPMGVLQSTSTQNDYVATFWLVCFVSFALISAREQTIATYLLAGISLGLAILTKSTSILFAAPFLIWTGLVLLKKLRENIWKPIGIVTLAVLVINSGYFARNLTLFGNPLGLTEEATDGLTYKYTNDIFTPKAVTSNVLRNVGLQLVSPFERLNILVSTIIIKLHDSLGMDPNDPRITWAGTAFDVGSWSVHEDTASNPWHFIFVSISLLLLLNFRNQDARIYAACLVAGFLLFCLILKWQPWHSRLLLPLFVLAMPLSIVIFSHYLNQRIMLVIMILFMILALQPVFGNNSRPVLGKDSIFIKDRSSQYFKNQPALEKPYRMVIEKLPDECTRVGLILQMNSWEYPLWVLGKNSNRRLSLEHVKVENNSKQYGPADFIPCAIIDDTHYPEEQIILNGRIYKKLFGRSPVSLLIPTD